MKSKKAVQLELVTRKKNLNRLVIGLGCGFLVMIGLVFLSYGIFANPFPIKEVEIAGNYEHISDEDLANVMADDVYEGFFGLDISELKTKLGDHPWIYDAKLRRVWPDKLKITIIEHKPLAIWNDAAILTKSGALITPNSVSLKSSLPTFTGPDGRHEQIYAQWQEITQVLSQFKLDVSQIALEDRGSWELSLANGIKILLGTQEIELRLERFVRAYDQLLSKQHDKIDYVDLRYTSGIAVGWKKSSNAHESS